jgi:hypothetical protein
MDDEAPTDDARRGKREMNDVALRRAHALSCVECDRVAIGAARGWVAMLTGEDDTPVAIYCPTCGAGEFGWRQRS